MLVSGNTFPLGTLSYNYATYGEGVGPIHVDNLYCSGPEFRLSSCRYDNDTSEDYHYEDWSISCPRGGRGLEIMCSIPQGTTGFAIVSVNDCSLLASTLSL